MHRAEYRGVDGHQRQQWCVGVQRLLIGQRATEDRAGQRRRGDSQLESAAAEFGSGFEPGNMFEEIHRGIKFCREFFHRPRRGVACGGGPDGGQDGFLLTAQIVFVKRQNGRRAESSDDVASGGAATRRGSGHAGFIKQFHVVDDHALTVADSDVVVFRDSLSELERLDFLAGAHSSQIRLVIINVFGFGKVVDGGAGPGRIGFDVADAAFAEAVIEHRGVVNSDHDGEIVRVESGIQKDESPRLRHLNAAQQWVFQISLREQRQIIAGAAAELAGDGVEFSQKGLWVFNAHVAETIRAGFHNKRGPKVGGVTKRDTDTQEQTHCECGCDSHGWSERRLAAHAGRTKASHGPLVFPGFRAVPRNG